MSILDKKGIGVTSGFKLVSGAPIDARFTAEDDTDLQSLIDNGAVYEGLEVYVKSTKKKMVYNGTEFVEFKSASSVDTAMSDSSTNPVQNKVIKKYVDNVVADIDSPEIYLYDEPFPEANANVLQGIKLNNVPWNVPIGTPIKYIEFVKESTETFEQFVNRAIKTYEIPYQLAKAAKNKEISLVVRITMPNNLFTVHYDYILSECVYEETYLTWSNYSMLTFYNIRLTEDESGNSVPTKHTVSLWTYYSSGTPTIMNSYTTTPLISTGGSGGSVDLSNYFTKTETEQAIQTAINNITKAEDGEY
jgi:hypothetical protein